MWRRGEEVEERRGGRGGERRWRRGEKVEEGRAAPRQGQGSWGKRLRAICQ